MVPIGEHHAQMAELLFAPRLLAEYGQTDMSVRQFRVEFERPPQARSGLVEPAEASQDMAESAPYRGGARSERQGMAADRLAGIRIAGEEMRVGEPQVKERVARLELESFQ